MMNSLRALSKTLAAKLLIIVLVLSFGVWGISDFVSGIDPSEVGRAGATPVSVAEFSRAYEIANSNYTEQQGRALSQAESRALANQVLQSLLAEALQVDAARGLGVDVSDEAVAQRIRDTEQFAGAGGFETARFRAFLNQARISEREYVDRERDGAVQELWVNSMVGDVGAPVAYLEAVNRWANQTRTVATIPLTADALGPIADPTEETLRAYYDAHKTEFRSPERRTFSVMSLSPEALAEPAEVSPDAVRKAYDAPGAYGEAERRQVSQAVVADRAAADAAATAINSGTPFEEVLKTLERAPADVDLGTVAKSDILNPEVAEAAFGLESGKATVVDTRFGPTLVRVGAITGSGKVPFESVEAEIRKSIALDEAVDQVRGLETSVLDAVAGGDQIADVAGQFDLPVVTISGVDRTGTTADGSKPEIPGGTAVLTNAFAQATGADAAEVRVGDADHWVQVDAVEQPADRPYEDVVAEVIAAWTAAEKAARMKTLSDEAVAALRGGATPEEVAARYGATVTTSAPFSRAVPAEGLPSGVAEAALAGPAGTVGSIPFGADGHMLFKVVSVEEPVFFAESADLEPLKQNLDEGLANTLVYDAMNAWQADAGATVNQSVVDAVVTGQPIRR